MTRRSYLTLSATALAGAVLTACGATPTAAPAATQAATQPPAAATATTAPAAEPTATTAPPAAEAPAVEVRLLTSTWGLAPEGKDAATAAPEDFWTWIFDEFRKTNDKYQNSTLRLEIASWGEIDQKLNVSVAAGDPPDTYCNESFLAVKFAQQGLLEPIDDLLTADDKEDFIAAAVAQGQFEGKTYAWPWNAYGTCVIVNKRMFEDLGAESALPDEKGFWNFDEFLAACQATTGDGRYGFTLPFQQNSGDYQRYSFLWGRGASIFSEDGKSYTFNSPEGVDGLQYLVDLEYKHKVLAPGAAGQTWDDSNQLFNKAQAAICVGTTGYNAAAVQKLVETGEIDPEKVEVIPAMFPNLEGIDPPRTFAGADGFMVFKQPNAADLMVVMDFCAYVCNSANQHLNVPGTWLPVRKSAADMWASDPFMQWLAEYTVAYSHPDGQNPYYKDTRAYLVPAFQEAMSQQKSAKEALDSIADDVNGLLQQA
ncbi:MAG: ABC transporter substrate-binding protein [Anaerolineae bacterium]